jgi:urease accessory protein
MAMTMTMSTNTHISTSPGSSLALWRLISPMLPIGAYAWSQGLEYAVETGWVVDEAAARSWIGGVLEHNLAAVDIPVLARLYHGWAQGDAAGIDRWGLLLRSLRETSELVHEDRELGRALARLLCELDIVEAQDWRDHAYTSYAAMFALAACRWDIPLADAARGYLWAWCENQVSAAMKLVPLGQNAGQRVLGRLMPAIDRTVERGLTLADEDIGATATGLGLASAAHETQYSRLFRS